MGFSTVAATAILGGTCVLMITIFTGGVLPTISDYHEAYKNLEVRGVERIQTNINITNVTNTSGTYYDLNVTVKNTGRITLKSVYSLKKRSICSVAATTITSPFSFFSSIYDKTLS